MSIKFNFGNKIDSFFVRSIIKIESESQKRSPTKMLLDEWGTSGQKRATVGDLLQLLIKVELFRAADFVAVRILNEPPPKRPETGPAAHVDITLPYYTHDHKQTESILDALTYPRSSNLTLANEDDVQNNNKDHPVESGGDRIKLSKTRLSIQPDELSDLILFSNQNMLGDNNNMLPTKAELSESIALDTLDTESDFNCIDTDSIIISDMDIGDIPDLSAVLNARKSHTTTIDDCLPDISKLNLDLSVEKDYDNSSQLNNIPDITMLQNL